MESSGNRWRVWHRKRNPLTYIANIENLSPLLGGLPSWHSQLTTIVNHSNLSASGCEITGERFQPKRITDGENCGTFSTLASPVLSTSPAHISELANNDMDVRRLILRRCLCLANGNRLAKYRLRRAWNWLLIQGEIHLPAWKCSHHFPNIKAMYVGQNTSNWRDFCIVFFVLSTATRRHRLLSTLLCELLKKMARKGSTMSFLLRQGWVREKER